MNTQPEALRLADDLEGPHSFETEAKAAAELRRLYEVNQMLVEALNGLIDANQSEGAAPGGFSTKGPTREHQQRVFDAWQKIGQALAKAKEQA